jgi:hypothetical protein
VPQLALRPGVEGVVDAAQQPRCPPQRADGAAFTGAPQGLLAVGALRPDEQRLHPVRGEIAVDQHPGQQRDPLGGVGDAALAGDAEHDHRLHRRPDRVLQGQQVGELAGEPRRGRDPRRDPGHPVGPPLVALVLRQ